MFRKINPDQKPDYDVVDYPDGRLNVDALFAHGGNLSIPANADKVNDRLREMAHKAFVEGNTDSALVVLFGQAPESHHTIDTYPAVLTVSDDQWQGIERVAGQRGAVPLMLESVTKMSERVDAVAVSVFMLATRIHQETLDDGEVIQRHQKGLVNLFEHRNDKNKSWFARVDKEGAIGEFAVFEDGPMLPMLHVPTPMDSDAAPKPVLRAMSPGGDA